MCIFVRAGLCVSECVSLNICTFWSVCVCEREYVRVGFLGHVCACVSVRVCG